MKHDKITDCYYKATDKFIDKFYERLKEESLSLEEFCKQNYLDLYAIRKVMDKKIKMAVRYHYLIKIAKLANVQKGIIVGEQPIATHGKDYSERKRAIYD